MRYVTKGMWKGYAKAMIANGLRPISFYRLSDHFDRNGEIIGDEDCWLGGNEVGGVFWPSHGGYTSLRRMRNFLVELLDGRPTCFAVTEKVGRLLERQGWVYAGRVVVDYPYTQEKVLLVNYMWMVPSWPPSET